MNVLLRKGIYSIVLVLLIGFVIWSNRQIPKTQSVETHATLTSHEFVSLFQKKNTSSLDSYIEKAIEVKGILKKTTYKGGKYTLLLSGDSENNFIICEMQDDQIEKIRSLEVDNTVIIKGIFKGVLLDAILLNCILIDS